MTKQQAIWAAGIGAVAAAALLLVYLLLLPADVSWSANRMLHHAWQGATALAAGGAIFALLRLKPVARRRDLQREGVRRRAFVIAGIVVAVVGLLAAAELYRDHTARRLLRAAGDDLAAIADAIQRYREGHGGLPPTLEDLAPDYLPRERLYYAYRGGPRPEPPPPADQADAPPPSYVLVRPVKDEEKGRPQPPRLLAYLRPGSAWATLTVVLDSGGQPRIRSESTVRAYEKAAQEAPPAAAPDEETPPPASPQP